MSNWWHVVWGTARAEFSDLGSAADVTQVLMRLGLALILGGILGFEREMSRRDAGMRTHMMVSVGAALFVVVPLQAGFSQDNMSRVLQGLVSGVGFLGAGAIIKQCGARGARSDYGGELVVERGRRRGGGVGA